MPFQFGDYSQDADRRELKQGTALVAEGLRRVAATVQDEGGDPHARQQMVDVEGVDRPQDVGDEGRRLAAGIPGARFVALEGRNHLLLEDEPAWARFLDEVHAFLRTAPSPAPMQRD
jgi:hypothetical protein